MLRQTAHPTEPRYEVLALFTVALTVASFVLVAVGTLMPFFAAAFGKQQSQLGLIVTALILGNMLTCALSGAFTDRFGDKAMLIVSGVVMGGSLMLAAAIPSLTWLLLWFFVFGVGYASITPAGSHAILFLFSPRERGFAMGLRQTGVPLGGVLGALLLSSLASHWGYRVALFGAGAILLVVILACALLYREPSQLRGEPLRTRLLIADMLKIGREPALVLVTVTSMLLFCAQIALMGFFPSTLVHEAHLDVQTACTVFIIAQLFAIGGRLFWGWLSDRYFHGNRILPLAIASAACAAAVFSVGSAAQQPLIALCIVAAALGFTAEGWFGLTIIALAEIGGQEHSGSALGFGLTFIFAAGVVAPIAFGGLIDVSGYAAAWRLLSVVVLAGVFPVFAAVTIRKRAAA